MPTHEQAATHAKLIKAMLEVSPYFDDVTVEVAENEPSWTFFDIGGDYFIEESDSAAGPLYAHTTYLYLIDREGAIRFLFTHEDTPEWIAAGVAQLLETEPS